MYLMHKHCYFILYLPYVYALPRYKCFKMHPTWGCLSLRSGLAFCAFKFFFQVFEVLYEKLCSLAMSNACFIYCNKFWDTNSTDSLLVRSLQSSESIKQMNFVVLFLKNYDLGQCKYIAYIIFSNFYVYTGGREPRSERTHSCSTAYGKCL